MRQNNSNTIEKQLIKPSILFIMHLPPPIHGAAVVGKMIKDSELINGPIKATYINLSTSNTLEEIGHKIWSSTLWFLSIVFKIIKHLIFNKTDLCYITLNAKGLGFYKDFIIVIFLKLFRKKILFHFHNKGVSEYENRRIDRFLYKICFKNTKSILLTPLLYHDLASFVDEKDVFYCPNGIPEIYSNNIPTKFKNNQPCTFLWLSNMMINKGVVTQLKSCRILKEKGVDFKFHFVGAWSDFTEDMFNETVKEFDLEGMVFAHGKKYNEDKIDFFLNADVFVFPTYNDTFGLVILEAMQASLPVITTFEGGIPDVVEDGVTAFLVPKKNEEDLAKKMELLANNPELRQQMGNAGRVRYDKNFTLEVFEKRFSKILKSANK
ncbi:glycosyltransferase family 4 protein [Maribacter sp. BPC-D8]|uniref:glycosyltransferase family 4 protein n=1 Tax=Maribacter sp. BPC-D8 TaxID=3053613 RepID=UPI002B468FF8|nr:glycosyltransferase family 4 protein [Maribacter sp. BPC-D8]WRI28344.1 glycosyltransferase family 4 protein [Maribacter sp. BPC-D8]